MQKYKEYDPDELKHVQNLELKILKEIISICETHGLKYYAYAGTLLGTIRHGGFIPWDDDIDIIMFRDDYEKLLKIMETELSDEFYVLNICKQKDYYMPISQVCLKGTRFENSYELPTSHVKGICMDIFPLDNISESPTKQKIQHNMVQILFHLLKNSLYNINTPNKIISLIHSLMHHFLKIIPGPKFLKKRYLNCLTRYNEETTNYGTVFFSQVDSPKFGKYGFFDKRDFEPAEKVKFEDIYVNVPKNYDKILSLIYEDHMTLPPIEKRRNIGPDRLDFGKYKLNKK